jgi:molybdopterin converting factor small subunit
MSVTVHLPSMLRQYAGGASALTLDADTLDAALASIRASHPDLYRSVCDETGAVRRHVNLFVNQSNCRDLEALATKLAPGDVVYVMPAVSGGSQCRNV